MSYNITGNGKCECLKIIQGAISNQDPKTIDMGKAQRLSKAIRRLKGRMKIRHCTKRVE